MTRQYVACKFRSGDTRSYIFHHDGEPVAVGDFVNVSGRHGAGWQKVEVVSISDDAPTFQTKPIHARIDPDAEPAVA